eukprot:9861280-Lingulodinium_polyedra.AAC.1
MLNKHAPNDHADQTLGRHHVPVVRDALFSSLRFRPGVCHWLKVVQERGRLALIRGSGGQNAVR